MKATRANVELWAKERGLESVQIDGIPEGFSFKESAVTIGDQEHKGRYIAYVPMSNWKIVYSPTAQQLLRDYNQKK